MAGSRTPRNTSDEMGALLVRRGLLTGEQLLTAVHEEQRRGIPFTVYVTEMGYVSEQQLATCISEQYGLPLVGSRSLEEIPRDVLAYLPRELAERYRVVPLRLDGNEVQVCLADPRHLDELDDVGRTIGRAVRGCVVTETALNDALDKHYGIRPETRLFREGKAPPPSDHSMERVKKEIERTGVFKAPPSVVFASSGSANAIQLLASADSANDVLRAAAIFFGGLFPQVVALGIHKGRALALMVSGAQGQQALKPPIELTLAEGSLIRSVLERPQVIYRPNISDTSLISLCQAVRMPPTDLTALPAFDLGRPAFVVIGQGLDERQVKERFADIKSFLGKISKALRAVALRAEIKQGP
jgi:hypothetical protein